MNDYIDRQAAIDEIARWKGYLDEDTIERIQIGLKKLPSVEPEVLACGEGELSAETERKKGKWIDETFKPWGLVYHPYRCDQCGDHADSTYDYCPNCGARMDLEEGEEKHDVILCQWDGLSL